MQRYPCTLRAKARLGREKPLLQECEQAAVLRHSTVSAACEVAAAGEPVNERDTSAANTLLHMRLPPQECRSADLALSDQKPGEGARSCCCRNASCGTPALYEQCFMWSYRCGGASQWT